ncbi:polysaccharide deacetylase family protein [Knoellia locipacati]|uniref:NodB homology domain-containing protein n=1 Tax=Knoellia locipacati TaxID=882824 RepID=A0A512T3P9_9MICO|nr:polysaccharide deacetylase family protein [Knoellia locipacati]GEQ14834.1 hypothetical protein KLO01_28810 [Knoellia locipacati]
MTHELSRGVMLISIDTEMAWGAVHHGSPNRYHWPEERDVLRSLLDILDEYDVPATWATVGHLFLEGCENVEGDVHPEIARPDYPWLAQDWFEDDPCAPATEDSRWYAPDLVREILERRTRHEVASHGFSHLIVGDPGCSAEVFDSELAAARAAAEPYDVELRSFVYPRNSIGHQDVLRRHGYIAYRGVRPDLFGSIHGRLRPLARVGDLLIPTPRSVVRPVLEGDLWNFPATVMYGADLHQGRARLWQWQHRRRLRHAARHGGLFHVWFHPHNLQPDPANALRGLESLCRLAAELRSEGRLETLTFGGLADLLGHHESEHAT